MGGWHFHLTPRWKGILWPRNTRLRSSRCTQSLLMAADLSRAVLYGSRSNISNIYKWHKNPLSVVLKNEECGFKLNYDTKNVTKSENDVMCRNCFICHLSRSFKACPFPTHSHPPPMSVPLYWIIKKKYFFACLLWRDSQWGEGCRGEEWLHAGGSMYIVQRHQVALEGAPPWSFYPLEIEKCNAKLGQQRFVGHCPWIMVPLILAPLFRIFL